MPDGAEASSVVAEQANGESGGATGAGSPGDAQSAEMDTGSLAEGVARADEGQEAVATPQAESKSAEDGEGGSSAAEGAVAGETDGADRTGGRAPRRESLQRIMTMPGAVSCRAESCAWKDGQ